MTAMNRWLKRALIAIPVLVALFFGAIFLYAKVLNDAPEALSEADLSEAVAGPSRPTTSTPARSAPLPRRHIGTGGRHRRRRGHRPPTRPPRSRALGT